jgi:hypothetical protein
MAKKNEDDIVVFNHDGRVVSNDPRFKAEEYEEPIGHANTGDIGVPDEDDDEDDEPSDYDDMTVDELKDELKTRRDAGREIDTTGVTKKSELIEALKADDNA